jgi:hypothetical protein
MLRYAIRVARGIRFIEEKKERAYILAKQKRAAYMGNVSGVGLK